MLRSAAILAVLLTAGSGCAVTQDQNTPVWQWREIHPTTGRGFWIYVPSNYREDTPSPLIISCHGTPPYDVAEHHIREWKFLGERYGCIIVCPELEATDGLIGDGPIIGMLKDERYILSLIGLLGYRYNIDRANVMITGFSGGGFPTYWVGLRHPEIFSAVAARNCNFSKYNLDGWYPPEAREVPILVYYGAHDPAAISLQSKAAVRYFTRGGFNVESLVLPGQGHQRNPELAMDFFRKNWRRASPSMRGD